MSSTDGIFGLSVARGGSTSTNDGAGAVRRASDGARRRKLSVDDYVDGITRGDRATLGRAISLVESRAARHRTVAQEVLGRLMGHTGGSLRLGITGVPGVGKSTFIERLGCDLTARGHRVAVLAVDPSSGVTGGSILGDKTRMAKLSTDDRAFIRPSPTAGTLGGVAQRTRETMLLCEAAGFDVVLVETVGVGQSETMVSEMTDLFLALMLPGAGDELQGIKRGLLELVDVIAVNKADGDAVASARRAATEYRNALHCAAQRDDDWTPPVVTCSAAAGHGVTDLWTTIADRVATLRADGRLQERRREQLLRWTRALLEEAVLRRFYEDPAVIAAKPAIEARVLSGTLAPAMAARRLLEAAAGPDPT